MSEENLKAPIGRRPVKSQQPAIKGCCCKRSQCIKNYCDCYQSMAICTKYCKCIGCRNTEERKGLITAPLRNSSTLKRERAAALTAKAAAAAAREAIAGKTIVSMSMPLNASQLVMQNQQPVMYGLPLPFSSFVGAQPIPINVLSTGAMPQMAVQQYQPALNYTPAPTAPEPKAVQSASPMQSGVRKQTKLPTPIPPIPPPTDPKDFNIFTPSINAELLQCIITQVVEAQEIGLDEVQIGQLVLHELKRGLLAMSQAMLNP